MNPSFRLLLSAASVATLSLFGCADECSTCSQLSSTQIEGEVVSTDTTSLGEICGVQRDTYTEREPQRDTIEVGGFASITTTTFRCE